MDRHRISSSPVPPSVQLATLVVSPGVARRGGPPAHYSASYATTAVPATATDASAVTMSLGPFADDAPAAGGERFADFSLMSNRAGGPAMTSGSWDAGDNTSNLTFSQVTHAAPRQPVTFGTDNAVMGFDEAAKAAPRNRAEAAVRFASFGDGAASAMESRPQLGGSDPRSVGWEPQGLFGAALDRFQTRAAVSIFSAATASMGGTVLGAEVPDDLPPEPSASVRRRGSGPSVHAIQFDTDYGGSASPFMSITSPGISRRSISRVRASVPQLSTGSIQMSANSFEREATPTVTMSLESFQRKSQPPSPSTRLQSSAPSPTTPGKTVPVEANVSPRSLRAHCSFAASVLTDDEAASGGHPAGRSLKSPSADTACARTPHSFRRHDTSASSRVTIATTAIGEEEDAQLQSGDFFLGAEAYSPLHRQATAGAARSLPASSMTGVFEGHSDEATELEEQKARAKLEFAEAAGFKKLRFMETSEGLAQGRRDRAAERRGSKYAGYALLQQIEAEEAEQLDSSMRARMRAAEAEHQQSLRSLREGERFGRPLPATSPTASRRTLPRVPSAKRSASEASSTASFAASVPSQLPAIKPSLSPPLMSADLRVPTPPPKSLSLDDGEVLSEIHRQRRLKQQVSLKRNSWRQDQAFEQLK